MRGVVRAAVDRRARPHFDACKTHSVTSCLLNSVALPLPCLITAGVTGVLKVPLSFTRDDGRSHALPRPALRPKYYLAQIPYRSFPTCIKGTLERQARLH
jgi:hypothetical protein